MTYSEWNKHISNYFFKPENAGKNILFYLSKQDLIKYSRPLFSGTSDEEIWADFLMAIKYGQQEPSDLRIEYSPVVLHKLCQQLIWAPEKTMTL